MLPWAAMVSDAVHLVIRSLDCDNSGLGLGAGPACGPGAARSAASAVGIGADRLGPFDAEGCEGPYQDRVSLLLELILQEVEDPAFCLCASHGLAVVVGAVFAQEVGDLAFAGEVVVEVL